MEPTIIKKQNVPVYCPRLLFVFEILGYLTRPPDLGNVPSFHFRNLVTWQENHLERKWALMELGCQQEGLFRSHLPKTSTSIMHLSDSWREYKSAEVRSGFIAMSKSCYIYLYQVSSFYLNIYLTIHVISKWLCWKAYSSLNHAFPLKHTKINWGTFIIDCLYAWRVFRFWF